MTRETTDDRDQDDFIQQDEDYYEEEDKEVIPLDEEELVEYDELDFDPDVQEIHKYDPPKGPLEP
jgi:hypothetical protein